MDRKKPDHLHLLCHIGDLAALLTESADIPEFLDRTVRLVARHLSADVCSIYMYEELAGELALRATVGLNPEAVGRVRMGVGEGLVGRTFTGQAPIREARASRSPDFKYFEEAHEERFDSFLAVPIRRGANRIGVLVVQHESVDFFNETDVMALRAAASQLAGAIENARLLMDLHAAAPQGRGPGPGGRMAGPLGMEEAPLFIKGESGAGGYALGRTVVRRRGGRGPSGWPPAAGDPEGAGMTEFRAAVAASVRQIESLQETVASRLPESAALIFSAHFMILKDPGFIGRIEADIGKGRAAGAAVRAAARHYIDLLAASPHAYIREKVHDIEDLTARILNNLRPAIQAGAAGLPEESDSAGGRNGLDGARDGTDHGARDGTDRRTPGERVVVIAEDLYPSEILKLAAESVAGIVLARGGVTSHVAILARSLGIPMVIAERPDLLDLPDGTLALLDADMGNIHMRPGPRTIRQFEDQRRLQRAAPALAADAPAETRTADGVRVRLSANINLLAELETAIALKAEGIGLYRTEFPFLIRPTFPSEAEQYPIYRKVFAAMPGKDATARTLDVGGDKLPAHADMGAGANPEPGLRAIRFSLAHPEILETQLRALLRAAAGAERPRILFPMISSVDEPRRLRAMVKACMAALEAEGLDFHPAPAIGIMAELPAVLPIIDDLAAEVDFMAIGTNDLIQHMLAADRSNEKAAPYYKPHHPSVLRAIAAIARAGAAAGIEVSVCGEMARDPDCLPFLVGAGIRKLSVDPRFLPRMRRMIGSLNAAEAADHAGALLAEPTLAGVEALLRQWRSAAAGPRAGSCV